MRGMLCKLLWMMLKRGIGSLGVVCVLCSAETIRFVSLFFARALTIADVSYNLFVFLRISCCIQLHGSTVSIFYGSL